MDSEHNVIQVQSNMPPLMATQVTKMTKPRKPRTRYNDNLSAEMILDAYMMFIESHPKGSKSWNRQQFNEDLATFHNSGAAFEERIKPSDIKNSRINQMFAYGLKKLKEHGVDTSEFELPPLRKGGKIGTDWGQFANKWKLKP